MVGIVLNWEYDTSAYQFRRSAACSYGTHRKPELQMTKLIKDEPSRTHLCKPLAFWALHHRSDIDITLFIDNTLTGGVWDACSVGTRRTGGRQKSRLGCT
jgi:hypothetical protein